MRGGSDDSIMSSASQSRHNTELVRCKTQRGKERHMKKRERERVLERCPYCYQIPSQFSNISNETMTKQNMNITYELIDYNFY